MAVSATEDRHATKRQRRVIRRRVSHRRERDRPLRLEQFRTIIYYEQRGCGRSEAPADPDAYSLHLLVADLEALCQAWGQERIIALGYSFGGEVALEYALTVCTSKRPRTCSPGTTPRMV
jgi:pimeloyl-ACP methyl ester carboxylesterase